MPFFYSLCNLTMKGLLLLLSDWEVEGRGNVPHSGPLIVVANHLNLPDPPLLTASIPRRIIFMAKEELFRSRGGPFIRWFGAFPVRRGELDREAIRQAMKVLDAGLALGMFPEGRRSPNSQLILAEPGTALIALRSRAPILPVGISGTEKVQGLSIFRHRPRIRVNIGQPFTLPFEGRPTREKLSQATELIMRRIAELLPPKYQGVYGNANLSGQGDGVLLRS